jgi:hypothetical protein
MRMTPVRSRLAACALAALVVVGAGGCGVVTSEPPPPPVGDSTLVETLVELHLARVRQQRYGDVPSAQRDSVLARHGLTPTRFDEALRYYARHPKAYHALYGAVIDTLARRSPRFGSPSDEEDD